MKSIKLFVFFLILTSCNKYFGKIEPNYTPKNDLIEVFSSDIYKYDQQNDIIFDSIIYPKNKDFFKNIKPTKFDKIFSLDSNSDIFFYDSNLYYYKDKKIFKVEEKNFEIKLEYDLDLDKKEFVFFVGENNGKIYVLSNKSKLFMINNEKITLMADFQTYITSNPILLNDRIVTFSVFGDIFEILLETNKFENKGKINQKNGMLINSNNYIYKDSRTYLFNSGTLIFLKKTNNDLQLNYYLDDLNILSSLDIFDEFIDAPFQYEDHLYFIDKKGMISVFDPSVSDILWELDINVKIKDFLFSKDGKLFLLTNNKILILNKSGSLVYEFIHKIKDPILLKAGLNELFVFNSDGLAIFDKISKKQQEFIKSKFNGHLEVIKSKQNIYLKDNSALYKISE